MCFLFLLSYQNFTWTEHLNLYSSACIVCLVSYPNSLPVSCSMFPRSTHETFAEKMYQTFKDHKHFSKPKLSRTDFTICHYAGDVSYTCLDVVNIYSAVIPQKLVAETWMNRIFRSLIRPNSSWRRTKITLLPSIRLC